MNKKLPQYILGKYQLIGTVTFSVLFALVYLNLSIPFSETAWFSLGDSLVFLHTLVFGAIAILTLIFSRMLMYYSKKLFEMSCLAYFIWCLAEISAVCGLYTWITTDFIAPGHETGLEVFSRSFINGAVALGIPYIVSAMYFAIIDKNNTIKLMNYDNVVTDEPVKSANRQKITLFDNSGTLKLSISPESLYYIESDDNYIKVWYTDSKGELTQYMLRCRLKTVEDSFKDAGLVRCNRKYIININKVCALHKENEGYLLNLCNAAIPPIPITKTYLDATLAYFTEQQPLMEPIEQ